MTYTPLFQFDVGVQILVGVLKKYLFCSPYTKNSTSFDLSNFFIQAAGLAYHHDAVVDIIKGGEPPLNLITL